MKTVRQLLQGKRSGVYTVEPDVPVIVALRLMAEHGIGALPVVAGGRWPAGGYSVGTRLRTEDCFAGQVVTRHTRLGNHDGARCLRGATTDC